MRESISPSRLMSSKPGGGIRARRAQQNMVGLVLAQHVVDEIGRDRELAAGFFLAGEAPLDQPGDDGAGLRNVRFISADSASHASRSSPSMS